MPLNDYVAALQRLLAATPFTTATSLSYEERPPSDAVFGRLMPAQGKRYWRGIP